MDFIRHFFLKIFYYCPSIQATMMLLHYRICSIGILDTGIGQLMHFTYHQGLVRLRPDISPPDHNHHFASRPDRNNLNHMLTIYYKLLLHLRIHSKDLYREIMPIFTASLLCPKADERSTIWTCWQDSFPYPLSPCVGIVG